MFKEKVSLISANQQRTNKNETERKQSFKIRTNPDAKTIK